ncbi:carbon-nitrogen hydrolase family protein [Marinomonas mediterranea]|jgi:Predicted amidohydrolase|uniref:Nitrilase/cyanide hydratase and apolipoprotein N-acyltransferase n=1 Tax=Marinomonas mediterranea (strain ATCC 700492 / JCM 21426 / NBRC 103028 / MMB-1) TaxID=717774 RepID=F2K195_MARM1|nr:carbon-nitrogen hydrolase family protein [Marinomonas mediterranea]ADZ91026.1 Nitrilase/cyanide hydratase and apolipoprotein N-acyltransferase [Marinomonas mediterranea MMB-1]WCN09063.1 carbon-nitrogen hydrolase family protein [Marinomonas mediterranea]WCN13094.1 carbon-nitrogen hydrolase family protein [Marinomonas mediterranea]WCN17165.1 carbon-nitrogen hydrolase family protein [Marinomonas mediterranea MMB-1]
MRIAGIQMTSTANIASNLEYVKAAVAKVAQQGADLVVLPENVLLFSGRKLKVVADEELELGLLSSISGLAKQYSLPILIGSHPKATRYDGSQMPRGRVRQSSILFDDTGVQCARYDKIHLFDAAVSDKAGQYRESDYIEPGDLTSVVVNIAGVQVGLSICYDLRFPELFRELAQKGAELIVVPAAFTYQTGKAHWQALLRARAIENQCYILGLNQCGWHTETRQTYGHSQLIDPWGEVVSELGEEPGELLEVLDLDVLKVVREKMPCLLHRRI